MGNGDVGSDVDNKELNALVNQFIIRFQEAVKTTTPWTISCNEEKNLDNDSLLLDCSSRFSFL